jgi:hypothetical protein
MQLHSYHPVTGLVHQPWGDLMTIYCKSGGHNVGTYYIEAQVDSIQE